MEKRAKKKPHKPSFATLYDKVLVKRIEAKEKTVGGIIVPESAKNKPAMGIVVSVGHGIPERDGGLRPLHVKVGQTVAWSQFAGQEIELEEEEYVVISEEEILGVVQDIQEAAR